MYTRFSISEICYIGISVVSDHFVAQVTAC